MNANRFLYAGLPALAALLSAACGGVVGAPGAGGAGGHGTSGSTGQTSTGQTSTGQTSTSTTTSTSSGTGGAGGGKVCGGIAGAVCAANEYCDFPDKQCGGNDNSGTCKVRPQVCSAISEPTCACDGKIYGNPCEANAAGVDSDNLGGCKPPPGQFGCGAHFCPVAAEYCEFDGSDVGNVPSTYGCKPLPASCGTAPSCGCLAGIMCGNLCKATTDGGLQVTCPGG